MAEAVAEKKEANVEAQKKPQFSAKLRFARITPRKLRYVIDLIRGKSYNEAIALLRVVPKRGSYFAKKLLESAMANATHIIREKNLDVDVNQLYVAGAIVNEGPMMKRWTAAPQGRAMQIKKRMSHIEFILREKEAQVKETPATAQPEKKQEDKPTEGAEEKVEKTEKKITKRIKATKRVARKTQRIKKEK